MKDFWFQQMAKKTNKMKYKTTKDKRKIHMPRKPTGPPTKA